MELEKRLVRRFVDIQNKTSKQVVDIPLKRAIDKLVKGDLKDSQLYAITAAMYYKLALMKQQVHLSYESLRRDIIARGLTKLFARCVKASSSDYWNVLRKMSLKAYLREDAKRALEALGELEPSYAKKIRKLC